MSERKGAIILLWIVAFGSLGLSGYMFITNSLIGTPCVSPPDTGLTLVGLWDDLATNKEYAPYTTDYSWLIEFNNNQFNDSNYIEISNNNTRFKLLKEGFYKITLLLTWYDIDPDSVYWAVLLRNDIIDHFFVRVAISANQTNTYHLIESSLYVKSTGLDNFTIRCYCSGDTAFEIAVQQTFNQLSIEYNN